MDRCTPTPMVFVVVAEFDGENGRNRSIGMDNGGKGLRTGRSRGKGLEPRGMR